MYQVERYNLVNMRNSTRELCTFVGQVEAIPVGYKGDSGAAILAFNHLSVDKSEYKIPDKVLQELAKYLRHGDCVVIASTKVARRF